MKFEADLQIMVDLLSGLHEGGPEATQALESLTFLVFNTWQKAKKATILNAAPEGEIV